MRLMPGSPTDMPSPKHHAVAITTLNADHAQDLDPNTTRWTSKSPTSAQSQPRGGPQRRCSSCHRVDAEHAVYSEEAVGVERAPLVFSVTSTLSIPHVPTLMTTTTTTHTLCDGCYGRPAGVHRSHTPIDTRTIPETALPCTKPRTDRPRVCRARSVPGPMRVWTMRTTPRSMHGRCSRTSSRTQQRYGPYGSPGPGIARMMGSVMPSNTGRERDRYDALHATDAHDHPHHHLPALTATPPGRRTDEDHAEDHRPPRSDARCDARRRWAR